MTWFPCASRTSRACRRARCTTAFRANFSAIPARARSRFGRTRRRRRHEWAKTRQRFLNGYPASSRASPASTSARSASNDIFPPGPPHPIWFLFEGQHPSDRHSGIFPNSARISPSGGLIFPTLKRPSKRVQVPFNPASIQPFPVSQPPPENPRA